MSKHLFIIGAQRSGTTYLWNVLNMHPDVHMAQPVRPEPKYFLDLGKVSEGYDAYIKACFPEAESVRWLGEKSTSYIEREDVARNIAKMIPDARILVILRDPVERAYSNYKFSVENGIETLSFSDALAAENERLSNAHYNASANPYAYRRRGHYIDYIKNYEQVFDGSQIYVIIHEEFVSNIQAISDLYLWLGVAERFHPPGYKKIANESNVPSLCPHELLECKKDLYDGFAESNKKLEGYLGRTIDAWRY